MPQPKEIIQTVDGEPLDLPDYFSWENFCQHFSGVGNIEHPNRKAFLPIQHLGVEKKHEACLEIGRAYRIQDITIKNGCADISISNFPTPLSGIAPEPTIMIFHLNYVVTQCNLPHIASYLRGDNFRIEIAPKEMISSKWSPGGKYSVQIGPGRLAFRKDTM